MFSNQIEHALSTDSMTVSHIAGVRKLWRYICLLGERECVSRGGLTFTRKRNNYINQFSKNKRMINYMETVDVIAAATTTAGAACQTFSRDRSHSLWYLRFLVRRHRRYHYFLCSLLTKSTVWICFCGALPSTSRRRDFNWNPLEYQSGNADHGHARFY